MRDIQRARRATPDWDGRFEKDAVTGWLVLVNADGTPVWNSCLLHRDAAFLRVARGIGWSIERVAQACGRGCR